MSNNDKASTKLERLSDALMNDILTTPDAEIILETGQDEIDRARVLFGKVKMEKAKAELDAWKEAHSKDVIPFDRATARMKFETIRKGDTQFDRKITIAARNGEAPTDGDIDGLSDDLIDLEKLDGEDEQK
jgi:RNA binding exosome subunit